ncbi:MAG: phenylalanine--tRNA ligase subunit beta, partial [Candidatus Omnitrophica bacterium]|nr:phenylalanine--tRNA ligase subunit beta [Candidatus Omnitrophota bacterium]
VKEYDDCGDVSVTIEDPSGCSRYIATLIESVCVKTFPADKAKLLVSVGNNPISNIVDITNFALFEQGQPLHAFDYDKLEGGKIIVRRAKKGEKIVTLDDVERTLDDSILVIADAHKPVAIAGIMGGRDTGVTTSTKRILLESAHFDLGVIRRGSRKLALSSDACYRFERGVSWNGVEQGSNRATDLLLELAGGKIAARKDVIAKEQARARHEIRVTVSDIEKLMGSTLDLARGEKILKRLGCIVVSGDKALTVIPPHFRNDLAIKEDVVEEIARVIGYDNLPMTLPSVPARNIPVDLEREMFFKKAEDILIAQGLNEILTYAMVSRAALEKTGYDGHAIRMQNPMSAEQELMKPTTLPNVLMVAASNMNRGQKDLRFFEVGKRYFVSGERWTLSVMMTGRRAGDWRKGAKRDAVDFFDLKGALEELALKLRVPAFLFAPVQAKAYELGQAAGITLNGQDIGIMGRVADEVLLKFDIKKAAVYFAEIDLEIVRDAALPREKFNALDIYPAAVRDVSLAVKGTTFAALKETCFKAGGALLRKVDLLEEYRGEKIEAGFKGLVLSLTYQSKERTLTEDELSTLHESVVQALVQTFGVVRR